MAKHNLEIEPCFCARCSAILQPGRGDFFHVVIDAVADPAPPIVDEPEAELRGKIKNLLERMDDLSPQEAMDQVHRRLTLYLCGHCFREWIENPTGT